MPAKKPARKSRTTEIIGPQLDHSDYVTVIEDLTRQLCELRIQYAKAQDDELEKRYYDRINDRADIVDYLQRIIPQQAQILVELNEQLVQTTSTFERESAETNRLIDEAEAKYAKAQQEFESDRKILEGDLNAYTPLRLEKDALLAKYDAQETETREQTRFHLEHIYNYEREQVIARDDLKQQIQQRCRLLEVDFHKTNDIRISALTQQLARENIALTNALDRSEFRQRRLQRRADALHAEAQLRRAMHFTYTSEPERLQHNVQCQAAINVRLEEAYRHALHLNRTLNFAAALREDVNDRVLAMHLKELAFAHKLPCLRDHIQKARTECIELRAAFRRATEFAERLVAVLLLVKLRIKTAAVLEKVSHTDEQLRASQRQELLANLSQILDRSFDVIPSEFAIVPVPREQGADAWTGILSLQLPSTDELLADGINARVSIASGESIQDVQIGSELQLSASSLDVELPPSNDELEEGDAGVSSSDDAVGPDEKSENE